MSSGIIATLNDILQSLPEGSPQASRLRLVIHALMDSLSQLGEEVQSLKAALISADVNLKRIEAELAQERLKREQIEQDLRNAWRELTTPRDKSEP